MARLVRANDSGRRLRWSPGQALPHAQISETIRRGCRYRPGPACPYRMPRSRERFAAAMAHSVMARLVRAIYSSTCAATGGPDTPGHDGTATLATTAQASDFAVVSEIWASRRA